MFRRSSKFAIDSIFDLQNSSNSWKSYEKFVGEWKESMQQSIDIANKNADKVRRLNKTTYDKKLYANDRNEGDRVLLRNNLVRGGTSKLGPHWENTVYIVTKK